MTIVNDVAEALGIEIDSLVLDAGYVSKELIGAFHICTEKAINGRIPARKGYSFKTLYREVKDLIGKGKDTFIRKHHAYFDIKRRSVCLRNQCMYMFMLINRMPISDSAIIWSNMKMSTLNSK